ncbi:hypothetical protein GCM10010413_30150 [Promicromonospora sukumoe]|uniref:SHOCT domain-containing protein n=1 Tax=Promicromonospora sukumoe TaxID=88382 RepID=A0A7W3PDA9_9MICO|nr:SHOCT domain-containing protein [Promicromonospora sukumoe]MBA8807765.1 hypothetical protein [Promicromonospora sukumoe]
MAPLRRFGRPGLIGTAARTAVIAGTAQATAGAISRRQAGRAQQQYEAQRYENQQYQPQQAAPPQYEPAQQAPAAPPSDGANDALLTQLAQLGELHGKGVLTEDEFVTAKAKLLG